jgi:type VI secretion system protein VasG
MLDLDLRALIGRLDAGTTRALDTAAGSCLARGHAEIQPCHMLFSLLEVDGPRLDPLLSAFGIDNRELTGALHQELERLRTGPTDRPVFSPSLLDWLQESWLLASIQLGRSRIEAPTMLYALTASRRRYLTGRAGDLLDKVDGKRLEERLRALLPAEEAAAGGLPGESDGAASDGSALGRFTIDLMEEARQGRIDPIFGRDEETRQMIDILARRRKNNPIVVGDPGVGKTAAVEGLALLIAEGNVPPILADVSIRSLDLGLLQAGASVRGEFENRLKQVIKEVKESAKPIILFIDEAHVMIGAGGAGGSDAANLLKPALARGELRTIAATTWKEYKKYFEKDAALARRFQVVKIDEPSPAVAVGMLRGLADRYADAHGVQIHDAAVVAAVEMSHRYLSGRLLPDKAVSLLDTCAARVRIGQGTEPTELVKARARLAALVREEEAIERDRDHGAEVDEERAAEIAEELAAAKEIEGGIRRRWEQEGILVEEILDLRRQEELDDDQRARLDEALDELNALVEERPLVHPHVGAEAVATVVAEWTGIPVGRVQQDEARAVLEFEAEMKARIKGQDHALEVLGESLRQSKAGLQDPDRPNGVFLLVGPSGVGKTETALGLADLLYGGERSMVTINMSEFQEKHTVSRLIGSPPGYVGFGEGGMLTEAVRQRPYSVVLLDECEKADRDVMNLFYQVFDKGTLSDGEGREIDFRNTTMLLTSNLATDILTDVLNTGRPEHHDELVARIRPVLSAHFKPALLARMTIVPYYPLDQGVLRMITDLKLGKVARRLEANHGVELVWDDSVGDAIAARCTEVETGARNVDHILRGTILPLLSREVLARLEEGLPPTLALVSTPDGDIAVEAR